MSDNSRILNTDIGAWDQLICQKQSMINNGFASMWANADDDSLLKQFKFQKPHSQEHIDAKLGPSTVECLVENSADHSSVYFFINFTSGTIWVYKDAGDDTPPIDVSGWHIACLVPINVSYIQKDTEEYRAVMQHRSLPDFTFTLARLYLDVSRARTLTDNEATTWGTTDWSKLTVLQRTNVVEFLNYWLTFNSESNLSAIGYSLEPTEQNIPGPKIMFAPTFLTRQTYPYVVPPNKPKNGNENNSIVSKIMTNQNQEPDVSKQPLVYSGNWIDPAFGGNFACSPDIFFTQWLLPIVQKINKYMEITPIQPTANVNFWGTSGSGSMGFWAGYNPAHRDATSDYFSFKPVASGSHDSQGRPVRYQWEIPQYELSASDKTGAPDAPLLKIDYTGLTRSKVTLSFDAGAQQIFLEGTTYSQAKADYYGSNTGWWKTYSHFGMTVTLNMTLTLNSVENGALQILVSPPPSNSNYYSINAPNPDVKGGWSFSDNIKEVRKAIVGEITERMDKSIPYVISTITNAFENQDMIVFPAGGVYNYFDPIVSDHNTLLCGLEFNGVNPPPGSKGDGAGKVNGEPDTNGAADTLGHAPDVPEFLRPHHLKRRVQVQAPTLPPPPDPTEPIVVKIDGNKPE